MNKDDAITNGVRPEGGQKIDFFYSMWHKPIGYMQMRTRFRIASTVLLIIVVMLLIYLICNTNLVLVTTLSIQ